MKHCQLKISLDPNGEFNYFPVRCSSDSAPYCVTVKYCDLFEVHTVNLSLLKTINCYQEILQ
jgi:hypothetical protein